MFMSGSQLIGFGAGGGVVPASVSFAGSSVDGTDQTTYTFTSHAIGTAAANRTVVVCISGNGAGFSRSVSGVTIGGVSATELIDYQNPTSTDQLSAMYSLAVASGTTATIVVTFSDSMVACGIGVFAAYGISSSTHATDTDPSEPGSLSLNVPANGIAIACSRSDNGAACTVTGVTEAYDENVESNRYQYGGALAFASAQTPLAIGFDASGSNQTSIAASWGPA